MKLERIFSSAHSGPGARGTRADLPRIVILGDSHMHALQEALKARSDLPAGVAIEARRLLKVKGEANEAATPKSFGDRLRLIVQPLRRSDGQAGEAAGTRTLGDTTFAQFLAIARSLRPTDILVSAVGGNQHAVYSTIQHPRPFDFHFPEEVAGEVDEEIENVPYGPLYRHFEEGLRKGDGATLSALKGATRARVIHLVAPPPKRDGEFIQRNHDTHFAVEGIDHLGVSRASLRLKFWKLQNRALAVICGELGIELLGPPSETHDAKGYLAEPYYARDATHANAAYGASVLDQLERLALSAAA